MNKPPVKPSSASNYTNPWQKLRQFTDARIGLGRAGHSIPTKQLLEFQMDHANACDAVNIPLDRDLLQAQMPAGYDIIHIESQAENRNVYLQRPDLGRRLCGESAQKLQAHHAKTNTDTNTKISESDPQAKAVLVVVDGLSSVAVQSHAVSVVSKLCDELPRYNIALNTLCLASQGRVALGDEVAEILKAEVLIVLIGERPGLSSPDSLGIYYTYRPQVGVQDSARNCISNIRPAGLSAQEATDKLVWLIKESIKLQRSGVLLKDQSEPLLMESSEQQNHNFLIGS